jgi:hypothetical protein
LVALAELIELLEDEGVIAELRRGKIQRLTDDVLLKRTIVLTNQRLVLIERKLGSFAKQYIFLKDIQGVRSFRHFRLLWLLLILGCAALVIAQASITSITEHPLLWVVGAGIGSLMMWRNAISIATTTDTVLFTLELSFDTGKADTFVNAVQAAAANQKQVAQKAMEASAGGAARPSQTRVEAEVPAAVGMTKKCPDCAEDVRIDARKCRFCGFLFSPTGGSGGT